MSQVDTSQIYIFGGTFLAASLILNVMLFVGNADKAEQIDEQQTTVSALTEQLDAERFKRQQQQQQLSNMDGQQAELGGYVSELQQQLAALRELYEQNRETAQQAETRLSESTRQIATLDRKVRDINTELEEARKTISNQQRYIRTLTTQQSAPDSELAADQPLNIALSGFSGAAAKTYPTVTTTLAADGSGLINIPLENLFSPGTLTLSSEAGNLIRLLADTLKQLPDHQILVIGHADARPIVSDLAERYPTNWELSAVRASTVVRALISEGIDQQQLTAAGKSANAPVRDAANAEAWQLNRRIELRVSR